MKTEEAEARRKGGEGVMTKGGDMEPERGWLIEHDSKAGGPVYLTVENEMFTWTRDSTKAIRLCRRVDAELLAQIVLNDCDRIAEHQWG